MEKYRVHEVAKDFGLPTKTITEILAKYATVPKNHMQVLTDRELSVIFDYLTQHNQVSGIQAIYADVQPKETSKPAASAPQQSKPQQAAPQQQGGQRPQQGNRPQQQGGQRPQQGNRPQQQGGQRPQQAAPQQQAQPVVLLAADFGRQ